MIVSLVVPGLEQYTSVFAALSEPLRVDIICQIAEVDELPCTTLDNTLSISKSTISYHIKILHHAGLIEVRKEGRNYFYRLRHGVLETMMPGLLPRLFEARSNSASNSS
jgi:ArsR family transcriptional regulator, arsenate/arsenite/antimonite-responsive transcriptional repressor